METQVSFGRRLLLLLSLNGRPQASAPFWKRVGRPLSLLKRPRPKLGSKLARRGIESSESFARFGEFQGLVVRRGTVSSQLAWLRCNFKRMFAATGPGTGPYP